MTQNNITLYHGDCLIEMNKIADKSVDMICTDLPYGTTSCHWDSVIPFDKLWKQYERVIKDNGAIVLTASQPFTSALIMSNLKMFKYNWVWEKSKATGFLNSKKRPLVAHEDIVIFCKMPSLYSPQMTEGQNYNKGIRKQQTENDVYGKFNQVEIKSNGARFPRSVQYFKTAESEGETFHKTQKPVALMEYLIKTYTNEGEMVLDNCFGSCSTGVAAVNLNRKFIGIERDEKYFEIGKERILKAKTD